MGGKDRATAGRRDSASSSSSSNGKSMHFMANGGSASNHTVIAANSSSAGLHVRGAPSGAPPSPDPFEGEDLDSEITFIRRDTRQPHEIEDETIPPPAPIRSFHEIVRHLGGVTALQKMTVDPGAATTTNQAESHLKQEFANDVLRLRNKFKQETRGLLNPRSAGMQYWDLTTGLCLVFTAFVTPFEVGVGIKTEIGALFIVNQVVNSIFIIDIALQFFIPVPDPKPENFGELLKDHRVIARHYFTGWFLLDVISVLPFDVLVVASPQLIAGGQDSGLAKSFKLIRIARLIKLARVLRASRIIQRWENSISISYSSRSLGAAVLGIIVLLHWFGCFWALLPQLQGNWRDAPGLEQAVANCDSDPLSCVWPDWDETCTGCIAADPSTSSICSSSCLTLCERNVLAAVIGENPNYVRDKETWICRAVNDGLLSSNHEEMPFTLWITACLVAMLQLVGGVAGIAPTNTTEYVVFVFAILAGTLAFAAIQGVIVQVMTNGDPDEINFRQAMDALNFMMQDQHVPIRNRLIVRDYFRRSKKLMKRKSYYELIDRSLSRGLRADIRFLISNNLFSHVWWLQACEREFLEDLSVFIERESFSAKENIPSGPETLNILMQGVATRGGAIIAVGGSWGDVIITSAMLRDTRQAKALGYCEVAKLSREALMHTAKGYPKSSKVIREASLKVAVSRAMMVISMYSRMHNARQMRRKRRDREAAEAAQAAAMQSHVSQLAAAGFPPYGYPTPYGFGGAGTPGNAMVPPWAMQPYTPQQPGAMPMSPPPHMMTPESMQAIHTLMVNGMAPPWVMMGQQGAPPPGFMMNPNAEPHAGYEGEQDNDSDSLPHENPVTIIRKIRGQLAEAEEESDASFKLGVVTKGGQLLKDSDDENRVVVNATNQSLVGGTGGGRSSPVRALSNAKLDGLMEKQEATSLAVQRIEAKLSRLDSLAESVAGINLTLKRAAENNRKNAPYTPARSPIRLPGSRRPPPEPSNQRWDDYEA